MTRGVAVEVDYVRPTNNIYTVLVAAAVILEIIALVVLFMRHQEAFGSSLFGG
jgi:hypothetical protein